MEVSREYAERAFSENPDSVEALHVWVICHDPFEQQEAGYLVACLTSSQTLPSHIVIIAGLLCLKRLSRPEEGLIHIQKAIQLDSRIPPYNYYVGGMLQGELVNTRRLLLSTKVCLLLTRSLPMIISLKAK